MMTNQNLSTIKKLRKVMDLSVITTDNLQFTTDRLSISLMDESHWPDFQHIQADDEIMKYIGPILPFDELKAKFLDRIRPFIQEEGHWLTLAIHHKATREFIGSLGFKIDSISDQRAEIGYLVLPKHSGQGYTTEACNVLNKFIFEQVKVRKIVAHCTTVNTGSWKVMEKVGLLREGELKMDFFVNDNWYDGYCYGLINPIYC
jgi:RimJ/RimL family protein N-acetyltransferase